MPSRGWGIPGNLMTVTWIQYKCLYMHCMAITKVNELRYVILQTKCGGDIAFKKSANFDLSPLPPCLDCLEQHVKRANYQVAIWKQAHIPEHSIPNPNKGHGWTYEDGTMQPLWTSGDVLPKQLVDILESTIEDTEDSEGENDSDMDATDSSDSDTMILTNTSTIQQTQTKPVNRLSFLVTTAS